MADEPFIPPKTSKPASAVDVTPKEPPAEILKQEFSMDPSLLNSDSTRVVSEDKSGITKPVETVKPEEIKNDDKTTLDVSKETGVDKSGDRPRDEQGRFIEKEVEKKEEVKPSSVLKPPQEKKVDAAPDNKWQVKQITPVKEKKTEERDYSGFTNEEASYLRQMSNEAFTFASDVLKKYKEASKAKNDVFLQHPEAYTLSPEFKQVQADIYFATKEAEEWSKALERCQKGEKFKDLNGFDEKGNVIYGQEFEPTAQLEELVRAKFNQALQVAQQGKGRISQAAQQFQSRYQADNVAIENERKARFAWVADPKLLDHTVNVPGVGEQKVSEVRNSLINIMPPYLRNSPLADVAADLFVALQIQGAELEEARNNHKVAETKREEAARGEPTSEIRKEPDPPIVGKVREFSLAGMPT